MLEQDQKVASQFSSIYGAFTGICWRVCRDMIIPVSVISTAYACYNKLAAVHLSAK